MLFTFTGRDASELYINCLTDIRNFQISNVDNLFYTVNNNRYVSSSTAGWYNESTICGNIEQSARLNSQYTYTAPFRLVGSLEASTFRVDAVDRGDFLVQCTNAISALNLGRTDELRYSLNGRSFKDLRTSGWWNTPEEVCRVIGTDMDSLL